MPQPNVAESIVRTLVLYALAEFQAGHAKTIRVSVQGHAFSVEDDGRGHAIARSVDGAPYLDFIYGHQDYPFGAGTEKPVQLQGLGMSLLNRLCTELAVTVRKPDTLLRMGFRAGRLVSHEVSEVRSEATGNTIAGRTSTDSRPLDAPAVRDWLLAVLAASPTLRLSFNGETLLPSGPGGS